MSVRRGLHVSRTRLARSPAQAAVSVEFSKVILAAGDASLASLGAWP